MSSSPLIIPTETPRQGSPGETWRREGKWDGVRAVVAVGGGDLEVRSRTDRDITATFPELGELAGLLVNRPVTLDGGDRGCSTRRAGRISGCCSSVWA